MTARRWILWQIAGRGLAGLLSLGSLGVATYCTINSDNEIGTAAAYLTGLFFATIAYTGRVPRVKIGDNELEPAAAAALGAEVAATAAKKAAGESDDPKEVAAAAQVAASNLSRSVTIKYSRMRDIDIIPQLATEGPRDQAFFEALRRRLQDAYPDEDAPDAK